MRVAGLMSGTSLDGIDAAIVEVAGADDAPDWRVLGTLTRPYSDAQRATIHDAILTGGARQLTRLHADLGEWLADVLLELLESCGLEPGAVRVVGSHGQTVWHEPPVRDAPDARRGASLQLGCPATIAERTGIDVVGDFRSRDLAAGGEGAPLVPWVERLLFSVPERSRVLLNVGGIANLTRLPPRGADEALVAFDTGPGNVLIDAVAGLASDGALGYDRAGERAARGSVDARLLEELLSDPWFGRPPPKSTGRERFGLPFARELARHAGVAGTASDADWDDLLATVTALTAEAVARALRDWIEPLGADELVVTGGGARNATLVRELERRLAPVPVRPGSELGVDPDAKEAVAFAMLAWAHVRGLAAGVPDVTGAAGPRILGSLTPGGTPAGGRAV